MMKKIKTSIAGGFTYITEHKKFPVFLVEIVLAAIGIVLTKGSVYWIDHVSYMDASGGLPFNLHFHPAALLGMVSVILFQIMLHLIAAGDKKWRFLTWSTGFLMFHFCGYVRYLSSISRTFTMLYLRDVLEFDIEIVHKLTKDEWYYPMFAVFFFSILTGFMYFGKWIGWSEDSDRNENAVQLRNKVMGILILIFSITVLVQRTFTNPWYLVLCGICSAVSLPVLILVEKICASMGLDSLLKNGVLPDGFFDGLLCLIFDVGLDEYDIEDDDDDIWTGTTRYTLDLLLKFADDIERELPDDTSRKEALVMMIKELRSNCDIDVNADEVHDNADEGHEKADGEHDNADGDHENVDEGHENASEEHDNADEGRENSDED